jgi:hypothetical protein
MKKETAELKESLIKTPQKANEVNKISKLIYFKDMIVP